MARSSLRLLAVLALLVSGLADPAHADLRDNFQLHRARRGLHGQILDFTANHGADRRVWSDSLCERRDVYVYLPPCYDPSKKCPVIFLLHGFAQDEHMFFDVVPELDRAIECGTMPPAIMIAPDGSILGRPCIARPASFFINSNAGRFEDYLMCDIWNWAHANFAIRPEREAHVLAGASMGGGAAFDLGMRHRDRVGIVAGVFPPVNLRYVNCHHKYMRNFDPDCWAYRTKLHHRWEIIARYFGGVISIPIGLFIDPLFGFGDHVVPKLSEHNPIEHIDRFGLRDGELAMYIAYGRRDEFNIDAHVESFLHVARQRGIHVSVDYDPRGHHNTATALRLLPGTLQWLGQQLRSLPPCQVASEPVAQPVRHDAVHEKPVGEVTQVNVLTDERFEDPAVREPDAAAFPRPK